MLGIPVDEPVSSKVDHQLPDGAAVNEGANGCEHLRYGHRPGIVYKLYHRIEALSP